MPSELTLYNSFRKYVMDGTIKLSEDTLKLMLVTSNYEPSATHDVLADVQASPDPEVVSIASPDNGYVSGGAEITGATITSTDSPAQAVFDADDVTWIALTATFRYGILYAEKSVGSPAIVNPLIGYITFDNSPGDVSVSGVDFVVQWNPAGLVVIA